MGVDEVRLRRLHDFLQASRSQSHLGDQANTVGIRRPVKKPALDLFLLLAADPCFGVVRCTVCQPSARCSRRIARVRKV
jgi:hypothetical protein